METGLKTPLYQRHVELGARMIDFGGWLMPVQYSGIIEEHLAVRSAAGLFDVSHMGEIKICGKRALQFLQFLVTNDIAKMVDGQCLYTLMCYVHGGVVDDLLIYKQNDQEYLLVVNAGNKDKDFVWIKEQEAKYGAGTELVVTDESEKTGQIALQGPVAEEILSSLTKYNLKSIKYYSFVTAEAAGVPAIISRTGYTGEDGFEIYMDSGQTVHVWDALLSAGRSKGLIPAGLGARDTLRFEAAMPLYGHELNENITPLEAGLGRFIAYDKGDFIGKHALLKQKEAGIKQKLVGFALLDRGIARAGYELYKNGAKIGAVTSGSFAPSLKANLGLGYVLSEEAQVGNQIDVIVRGKALKAEIVKRPFYRVATVRNSK